MADSCNAAAILEKWSLGMSGIIVKLGKGAKIRDGRLIMAPVYHDASAAIRAKKSKRVRVVKRNKA
jgi:hypothetical protein